MYAMYMYVYIVIRLCMYMYVYIHVYSYQYILQFVHSVTTAFCYKQNSNA